MDSAAGVLRLWGLLAACTLPAFLPPSVFSNQSRNFWPGGHLEVLPHRPGHDALLLNLLPHAVSIVEIVTRVVAELPGRLPCPLNHVSAIVPVVCHMIVPSFPSVYVLSIMGLGRHQLLLHLLCILPQLGRLGDSPSHALDGRKRKAHLSSPIPSTQTV